MPKNKNIPGATSQLPTAPGQAERLFAGAAGQDAQCLRRRTGRLAFHPDDPVVGLIAQMDLLSIADFDGVTVLETDGIGQDKPGVRRVLMRAVATNILGVDGDLA